MTTRQTPSAPGGLDILYAGTLPPHPGGSALVCGPVLLALARMGHRIRAVAPIVEDTTSTLAPFAAGSPNLTVARFAVPYYATVDDFLFDSYRAHLNFEEQQARKRISSWMAVRPADVIMLGRETCLWYLPDECTDLSAPVVFVAHGLVTHRWMSGLYPEGLCKEILARYQRAARIATPSVNLARFLASVGLDQVRVIPNPVDMELFAPRPKDPCLLRELSIKPDELVVVHASNLKAVKRPLDIVGSAEAALKENPGLVYVIVGDGEYRSIMSDACQRKGIADRFRFTGWVDHEKMPAYLNLADIVVMASEIETQALVYLEAQASGRLLLTSDIPAAREVVSDGENGLLFRVGDVDDLSAKTLLAAASPALRERIGRVARKTVGTHALQRVASAYDALLREVVLGGIGSWLPAR
jgi:glycosyltransferase involved in cell wall biosynthesis